MITALPSHDPADQTAHKVSMAIYHLASAMDAINVMSFDEECRDHLTDHTGLLSEVQLVGNLVLNRVMKRRAA